MKPENSTIIEGQAGLTQKEIKFRIKMGRNGISTIIIEFHKRSAVLW